MSSIVVSHGERVFRETLQSAATTGNGNERDLEGLFNDLAFYIDWSAGVSAGVVTLETADAVGYAGTWSTILAVTQTGASRQDVVVAPRAPYRAIRARISTNIVGGTVTVKAEAH